MSSFEYRGDSELAHYGVPGMRWGKRGASTKSAISKPHRQLSTADKVRIGAAAAALGYWSSTSGKELAKVGLVQLAKNNNARKAAAAGAAAAQATVLKIGANPTAAMRVVDGVWKLAA